MMNARAQGDGAALHALHDGLGDRRPGQPLVRRGPRGARARGADRSAGSRGSSPRATRCCRSRSRAASSGCTTTTRCCGCGYPGHRRGQDGLHGRRRAMPGGDGTARSQVARRRAAALRRPTRPGERLLDAGFATRAHSRATQSLDPAAGTRTPRASRRSPPAEQAEQTGIPGRIRTRGSAAARTVSGSRPPPR